MLCFLLASRDDSLLFLLQPFAEYDYDVLIPIFLLCIALFVLLWVISYIVEVRYREV